MKIKNLIGNRYGKLVVIKLCDERTKNKTTIWLCKCDCGNEVKVTSRNLITGHTKSCGCLIRKKEYVGKKINYLTILNEFKVDKCRFFSCLCDCGNTCVKRANNVIMETTKTCGCKLYLKNQIKNKILKDDNCAYIYISKLKEPAIIDIDDYDKIKYYHWYQNEKKYIYTRKFDKNKYVRIFLHRLIMPINENNLMIDHINGNPLDNRKCNLRIVTYQQNCWNRKKQKNNTTGVTGVKKRDGKFISYIYFNKKLIYLGSFKKLEEAKKARIDAEIKYFGKYRRKE